MNLKLKNLLRRKNSKLMVVPDSIVNELNELSKIMNTTTTDILCAGLELVRLASNKEISFIEGKTEIKLPILKKLKNKN